MQDKKEDRLNVYEIGYLIAGNVPEERLSEETDAVRKIVTGSGAEVIAEEAPHKIRLAYTIHRKTVAGSYDKHDDAYFGWIKFELSSEKVEAVKKAVEIMPSVIRMLLITTVRENTYLGKHAPTAPIGGSEEKSGVSASPAAAESAAPASLEEMDKSIDEMVKEA